MTARELIVALTKVDPDSDIRIYSTTFDTDVDTATPVVGVDPYEDATILVLDS